MDIKTFALLSLIGRAVSLFFLFLVMRRQLSLLKLPILPAIQRFRKILLLISIIILLGNVAPTVLDILTLYVHLGRPVHVSFTGMIYIFSGDFTSSVSAVLVWMLYNIAGKSND